MRNHITLITVDDIACLRAHPGRYKNIEVKLPGLDGHERHQVQQRLKTLTSECGCGSGGMAALIALLVTLPIAVWQGLGATPLTGFFWIGATTLGTVTAASLGAKLLTIGWARVKLRRELDRLTELYC